MLIELIKKIPIDFIDCDLFIKNKIKLKIWQKSTNDVKKKEERQPKHCHTC